MTMNKSFKSRGRIIVAEFLEVVDGRDVVFVVETVVAVVVSCGSKEPNFTQIPLTFSSPDPHTNETLPIIEWCLSSLLPIYK